MIYRSLTADDYGVCRAIRLEALSRHPSSFLTTFDEEHIRPKAVTVEWLDSGAVLGAFEAKDLCAVLSVDPERHSAMSHRGNGLHGTRDHGDYRTPHIKRGDAIHPRSKPKDQSRKRATALVRWPKPEQKSPTYGGGYIQWGKTGN